jgi:hypothetical protein
MDGTNGRGAFTHQFSRSASSMKQPLHVIALCPDETVSGVEAWFKPTLDPLVNAFMRISGYSVSDLARMFSWSYAIPRYEPKPQQDELLIACHKALWTARGNGARGVLLVGRQLQRGFEWRDMNMSPVYRGAIEWMEWYIGHGGDAGYFPMCPLPGLTGARPFWAEAKETGRSTRFFNAIKEFAATNTNGQA